MRAGFATACSKVVQTLFHQLLLVHRLRSIHIRFIDNAPDWNIYQRCNFLTITVSYIKALMQVILYVVLSAITDKHARVSFLKTATKYCSVADPEYVKINYCSTFWRIFTFLNTLEANPLVKLYSLEIKNQ